MTTPNQAHDRLRWKQNLQQWVSEHRDIPPQLADSIIIFFESAFEHTRYPQRAWFGLHQTRASLVIGGLYLAAIQRSGHDRGFWLLVDQSHPTIEGIDFKPIKSTQKSSYPLIWAHSASFSHLPLLIDNASIWNSFSEATEKILASPIANDRDSFQERWSKRRLSEFWPEGTFSTTEEQFQKAVQSALREQPEARRKRLENAQVIPNRVVRSIISFNRNPDVVAEVLNRANGHCENCGGIAPFLRRADNSPYLEVHHKEPLASGGKDTVTNAIALCPNCHRKAHYG